MMSLIYSDYFTFTLKAKNAKWKEYSKNKDSVGVYTVGSYFYGEFIGKLDSAMKKKIMPAIDFLNDKKKFIDRCMKISKENDRWNWGDIYEGLLTDGESCLIAIPGYTYCTKNEKGQHSSAWSVVHSFLKDNNGALPGIDKNKYAEVVKTLFELRYGVAPQDYKGAVAEFHLPAIRVATTKGVVKVTKKESSPAKDKTTTTSTSNTATTPTTTTTATTTTTTGDNKEYYMVVNSSYLSLRKGESADSKLLIKLGEGVVVELIKEGKKDTISGKTGKWMNVKVTGGTEGWCFGYYLKKVTPQGEFMVVAGAKKKVVKKVVIIDPGHGGEDSGCVGIKQSWKTLTFSSFADIEKKFGTTLYKESNYVLSLAKALKTKLESSSFTVELIRSDDTKIDLATRGEKIKKAIEKYKEHATIFISLHTNAIGHKNESELKKEKVSYYKHVDNKGNTTYYYKIKDKHNSWIPIPNPEPSGAKILKQNATRSGLKVIGHPKSTILSSNINSQLDSLSKLTSKEIDRDLSVLRASKAVPGVLVEVGFMSNLDDLKYMLDNQSEIEDKIVEGIKRCFK